MQARPTRLHSHSDDYRLMFLNSTQGGIYTVSDQFSIVSSSKSSVSPSSDDLSKPTATISGAPNPTNDFAATYAATNGVGAGKGVVDKGLLTLGGLVVSLLLAVAQAGEGAFLAL